MFPSIIYRNKPPYQPNEGCECPPQYPPPHNPGSREAAIGGYLTNPNHVASVTRNESPSPDYMVKAIYVSLCCFWPVGICAILKAREARNACARGGFLSARSSANSSRQLSNISIMIGVMGILAISLCFGLLAAVGNTGSS